MEEQKINFPKWFIYIYGICSTPISLFIIFSIVTGDYTGLAVYEIWKPGIFIFILLIINWFLFRICLSTIIISSEGIQSYSPVTRKRIIRWEDIAEVKRPFLKIPHEYTYVVSVNGEKMVLFRSMTQYLSIINNIKEQSSNLKKCNY